MLNVSSSTYSAYEYASLQNVEFTSGNTTANGGTPLYAWCESGCTSANSSTVWWVNLGSSTIAASGGTLTVYMNFMPSNVMSSSSSFTGEAPQLSGTYGQYDNGAHLFSYYQQWGGLSALPSGWSGPSAPTFYPQYTSFSTAVSTAWYASIPSSLSSYPFVVDAYGLNYQPTYLAGIIWVGPSSTISGSVQGVSFAESVSSSAQNISIWGGANNYISSIQDTNAIKAYTIQVSSATTPTLMMNYGSAYSPTTAAIGGLSYLGILPCSVSGGNIILYWMRSRVYPPIGVMPAAGLGSVA
jgi:hypothetical protein